MSATEHDHHNVPGERRAGRAGDHRADLVSTKGEETLVRESRKRARFALILVDVLG